MQDALASRTRPASPASDDKSIVGPVLGGVAGAVFLLIALAAFALWRTRRRRASAAAHASNKLNAGATQAVADGALPSMVVADLNDVRPIRLVFCDVASTATREPMGGQQRPKLFAAMARYRAQ